MYGQYRGVEVGTNALQRCVGRGIGRTSDKVSVEKAEFRGALIASA